MINRKKRVKERGKEMQYESDRREKRVGTMNAQKGDHHNYPC